MNMSGVDYAIDVTLRVVRVAERSPENSSWTAVRNTKLKWSAGALTVLNMMPVCQFP